LAVQSARREEDGHPRWVMGSDQSDAQRNGVVWVVSWNAVLSAAFVAGLNALGWVARQWLPEVATSLQPFGGVRRVGLVLIADDQGRVPDLGWSAAAGDRGGLVVVGVGALVAVGSLQRAVERGAVAALNLDQPFPELIAAVDRTLLRRWPPPGAAEVSDALRRREREAQRFAALTGREQDVLGALISGRSAAEIAAADRVSITTVRSQIQAILTKLEVTSQLAAVALAHRSCRQVRIVAHMRRLHQY